MCSWRRHFTRQGHQRNTLSVGCFLRPSKAFLSQADSYPLGICNLQLRPFLSPSLLYHPISGMALSFEAFESPRKQTDVPRKDASVPIHKWTNRAFFYHFEHLFAAGRAATRLHPYSEILLGICYAGGYYPDGCSRWDFSISCTTGELTIFFTGVLNHFETANSYRRPLPRSFKARLSKHSGPEPPSSSAPRSFGPATLPSRTFSGVDV